MILVQVQIYRVLSCVIQSVLVEREESLGEINHKNVQCPAVAIKSVQSFKSCKKGRTKMIPLPGQQITKCSDCGDFLTSSPSPSFCLFLLTDSCS